MKKWMAAPLLFACATAYAFPTPVPTATPHVEKVVVHDPITGKNRDSMLQLWTYGRTGIFLVDDMNLYLKVDGENESGYGTFTIYNGARSSHVQSIGPYINPALRFDLSQESGPGLEVNLVIPTTASTDVSAIEVNVDQASSAIPASPETASQTGIDIKMVGSTDFTNPVTGIKFSFDGATGSAVSVLDAEIGSDLARMELHDAVSIIDVTAYTSRKASAIPLRGLSMTINNDENTTPNSSTIRGTNFSITDVAANPSDEVTLNYAAATTNASSLYAGQNYMAYSGEGQVFGDTTAVALSTNASAVDVTGGAFYFWGHLGTAPLLDDLKGSYVDVRLDDEITVSGDVACYEANVESTYEHEGFAVVGFKHTDSAAGKVLAATVSGRQKTGRYAQALAPVDLNYTGLNIDATIDSLAGVSISLPGITVMGDDGVQNVGGYSVVSVTTTAQQANYGLYSSGPKLAVLGDARGSLGNASGIGFVFDKDDEDDNFTNKVVAISLDDGTMVEADCLETLQSRAIGICVSDREGDTSAHISSFGPTRIDTAMVAAIGETLYVGEGGDLVVTPPEGALRNDVVGWVLYKSEDPAYTIIFITLGRDLS